MNKRTLDNGGSRVLGQATGIRDEFLVALRRGRPEHSGDTEPVLVHVEPDEITLVLDDGEQLVFTASELRGALG